MDDIAQLLLDRNDYAADINKTNSKGFTPLFFAAVFEIMISACRNGHLCAVEQLLTYETTDVHGADPNAVSPFAAAWQGGNVEIVEMLTRQIVSRTASRLWARTACSARPFSWSAARDRRAWHAASFSLTSPRSWM